MRMLFKSLPIILILVSCGGMTPDIFKSDPVGASLYATKLTYEGLVKTAGESYINGAINDAQLKQFVEAARVFYKNYNTIASLHATVGLSESDKRIVEVRERLNNLQKLVDNLLKPAATVK